MEAVARELVRRDIVAEVAGLCARAESLGTKWGLFRHCWVLFKLLINVLATIILLVYMETLSAMADVGAESTSSSDGLGALRSPSPVLHAGAAVLLLTAATTLAVYKPQGMTRYGQRKQHEWRAASQA